MSKFLIARFSLPLVAPVAALAVGMSALTANAQTSTLYNPINLPSTNEISDTLTDKDIPTGFGGFARDYVVTLQEGDQVAIDLTSDEFDTIVTLIAPDGSTLGENDDGPDGSTNSLLFSRISTPGNYIVRVRPYGGQGTGSFVLKVTRLRPV
jgi:Bacterial pre-peptidase C-terminal domain